MYTVLLAVTDVQAWTIGLTPTVFESPQCDPPPNPSMTRQIVTRWRKFFQEMHAPWVAVVAEA
jgi:hypothetical protein